MMTTCSAQRGRGWSRGTGQQTVLVLLCSLILSPVSTQQIPTCDITSSDSLELNTSSPASFPLTCSLSSSLPPLDTPHWQWNKLADDVSPQTTLSSNISSTPANSTYQLEVECGGSGQYQASYLTLSGSCSYSCQFFVEVVETNVQQILAAFSNFPNQPSLPLSPDTHTTNLTYTAATTDILLGTCSSDYYLPSGCTLPVTATWYHNGQRFEPGLPLYNNPLSEAVTLLALTQQTAGYYVCVTELPYGLGRYRTVDVVIDISRPMTSPTPSPTALSPSTEPPPSSSGSSDAIFLGLKVWEAGVIAANVAVVLCLLLCLCALTVCLLLRRHTHSHRQPEHFPLKEMEENGEKDFVDFSSEVGIAFSDILFQELLHMGTFKTVHRGIISCAPRGASGLEVAVKRLKDEKSELGYRELMAEMNFLKSIQRKAGVHPHIMSLVGVTSCRDPPCLLLEFMPHNTLDRFLWSIKKGPIPDWYLRHVREVIRDKPYHKHVACDLMNVTQQVADGMCFLTGHGYIHRDLSTRNVLLGSHLNVKIGNPGISHEGYYYLVTQREHYLHDMAPECLWEKKFSLFSDVWSFGMTLYKVVTLETNPYPSVSPRDLYDHIVVNNQRPHLLSSFSNQLYFLLQRCWQVMPTERPTFPLILAELRQLSSDPTKHIILKPSKDEFTPGYVSENGQVFLHSVPPYIFQPGYSARRPSNTVSSADDTVYSRETAESLVYLYSSEVESVHTTQETDEDELEPEGAGHSPLVGGATPVSGRRGKGRGSAATEPSGEGGTLIAEANRDDVSHESHDLSCDEDLGEKDSSTENLFTRTTEKLVYF